MEAAPKARHPHGEQVSGTIPGHHHPIELNLSGFALSHPSLCKSMHRVCARVFIESAQEHFMFSGCRGMRKGLMGLKAARGSLQWGWQPLTVVSGWRGGLRVKDTPGKAASHAAHFQALLYLPVQYQRAIPTAALTLQLQSANAAKHGCCLKHHRTEHQRMGHPLKHPTKGPQEHLNVDLHTQHLPVCK